MAKISVVLVIYNEYHWIINWMNKMMSQYPDEIIVVDDRSTEVSDERMRQLLPSSVRLVKNDYPKGPFGAFTKGCSVARNTFVSCWSADDEPEPGYIKSISDTIDRYPFIDIITCNANVIREGKEYQRILLPFDAYISPDYMTKIFSKGHAKSLNIIGLVINKQIVLDCWEGGGKNLKANFDGMYAFLTMLERGFINLGQPLIKYRSFASGFGSTQKYYKIKHSIGVMNEYYKTIPPAYMRTVQSGIWSRKAQWLSQIALISMKILPYWARKIFYNWFYGYDWHVEKL